MPDARAADLMRLLLNDWLPNDSELSNLLPTDSRIEVAGIAEKLWSPDTAAEPADVVIAVNVEVVQSDRNNRRVNKDFEVEVDVAATTQWIEDVDKGSIIELTEIHDRVQQLLDTHRPEWVADGISGGTEGVVPDDERDRYAGVVLAGVSRVDNHATYFDDLDDSTFDATFNFTFT